MTLNYILDNLKNVKGGPSGQYTARCPAHDDRHASLSVSQGEDGRILMRCHAGCPIENITASLGIPVRDLFPSNDLHGSYNRSEAKSEICYPYYDTNGNLVAQKVRTPYAPKGYWRRPDGNDGWINNRDGVPRCLYFSGNPHSNTILVAEGEKDCDSLHALGFDAASGMDGAGKGKWHKEYTAQLEGKKVCIFQDNDDVGMAYGEETAAALYGNADSVQLIDLRIPWPEIPEHGDVTDFIEHFGPEKALEMITQLITDTPLWAPAASSKAVPAQSNEPALICAADIPYEPPNWLIRPYLQKGKGTLIQADNGTGKTVLACGFAAAVTSGKDILGIPVQDPGHVIVLSTEDDLPIISGRIESSGGDLLKTHFVTNTHAVSFTSPKIEQFIQQVGAKLIIFDPFQAFLGARVDMFRANETRPILASLFEMCKRNDCACILVCHTAKTGFGKSAVNMALGSVDIPAAARSILQVVAPKSNPDERIAVHIKSSNDKRGASLHYGISDLGGVEWLSTSDTTLDDLQSFVNQRRIIPYDQKPLVTVFKRLLIDNPGGGFWSYEDLKTECVKTLGFAPYKSVGELRSLLRGALSDELYKHDGLVVSCNQTGSHNVRGIRIERYLTSSSPASADEHS